MLRASTAKKNWAQSVKAVLLPIYAKYTSTLYTLNVRMFSFFFLAFRSPTTYLFIRKIKKNTMAPMGKIKKTFKLS